MRYTVDNDLHIHSKISACSNDPEQTPERILEYAKAKGLTTVCITDHFWDEKVEGASGWYTPQDFSRISKARPLPQADGIRFLFGCETELTRDLVLGLSKERHDEFDFIIIPATHFHMKDYTLNPEEFETAEGRAAAWIKHLDAVLDMDLPFSKVGIAHLICPLMASYGGFKLDLYYKMIDLLDENELRRVFSKAASLGVGIELNASDIATAIKVGERVLKPFVIAKECGCKFYFGSDAHHPEGFESSVELFEKAVDMLGLEESDKFVL